MRLPQQIRKTIKRAVFGSHEDVQQTDIGMQDPQTEIVIELHGLPAPQDVTNCHSVASAAPSAVAIGFDKKVANTVLPGVRPSLHFREKAAPHRLLGTLRLRLFSRESVEDRDILTFRICGTTNYCLPTVRLWARYLHWAYLRYRHPPDTPMTALDVHAMPVLFICPRPVGVVSVTEGDLFNMFPLNLMGSLGGDRFGFALNATRAAAAHVKRAKRIALSSIPLEQAALVRQLGRNHKRTEGTRLDELPFRTTLSACWGLPVPAFALRVRELEVTAIQEMGSHTFFVARVIQDEQRANGLQFCMIHGIYQRWRERNSAPSSRQ